MRSRQWQLKRQLKDAPQQEKIEVQMLLDDIKQEILVFSQAEYYRKRGKKKRKARETLGTHRSLLRCSSPQPRVADLIFTKKNLKIISVGFYTTIGMFQRPFWSITKALKVGWFEAHWRTCYDKYSLKLELGTSDELLGQCKMQKWASRSNSSLELHRQE